MMQKIVYNEYSIELTEKFLLNIISNQTKNHEHLKDLEKIYECLQWVSRWAIHYLFLEFHQHGLFYKINSVDKFMDTNSLLPCFKGLISYLFESFRKNNLLDYSNNQYYFNISIDYTFQDLEIERNIYLTDNKNISPYFEIIQKFLDQYMRILSGENKFLCVFFEFGLFNNAKFLYEDAKEAAIFNKTLASIVRSLSKNIFKNKKILNILEIGAGIGATTKAILNEFLNIDTHIKYRYTDISYGFLSFAKNKFSGSIPMQFSQFDFNKDPIDQDFESNFFDYIIGTNCLHNANDIKKSLKNLKNLLKKNGVLIISEGVKKSDYYTLIFGTDSAWWSHNDNQNRIEESPLLSHTEWKYLSKEAGFSHCISYFNNLQDSRFPLHDIFFIF